MNWLAENGEVGIESDQLLTASGNQNLWRRRRCGEDELRDDRRKAHLESPVLHLGRLPAPAREVDGEHLINDNYFCRYNDN